MDMDTTMFFLKYLKKKRFINDVTKAKKEVMTECVALPNVNDLTIRDAIIGMGTILEEDLENHYYITSVRAGTFGNVLTYAFLQRNDSSVEIIVFAHEGLVKQHLGEKTLRKLKTSLLSHG